MSTAVEYYPPSSTTARSRHYNSSRIQRPDVDSFNEIELADFNSPPPPTYSEQAESNPTASTPETQAPLNPPTLHLQIETTGKPILSLPLPSRPDPIPVYLVDPSSTNSSTSFTTDPKYISLRPSRGSGSCYLIPGDASSSTSPPLSTTTYRFGPGRPPRVRIFNPHRVSQAPEEGDPSSPEEYDESTAYSSFEILPSGFFTRAVRFRPPRLLGFDDDDNTISSRPEPGAGVNGGERITTDQYFEWRYATRQERNAYSSSSSSSNSSRQGEKIDCLLILSKVIVKSLYATNTSNRGNDNNGSQHQSKKKNKNQATETEIIPLARLVRTSTLRTKRSSASSAGNGGRLEILGLNLEKIGFQENAKSEGEMVLVMVVTTCLVMLKREVDRRRAQQIAMLTAGGIVGGGG